MATSQTSGVIQHLRRVLRDGARLTDGQLLEDYISRRDEAAFAALVRRHGPMVWGVCRRVLRNHHAAEDAFQATFLVLVRKAASIASRELLANWLYGVAHQTALKARATAAKRKGRERQVTDMPEPAVTQHDPWRDLQPVLDEELSRLPAKYRGVLVLCDLEGKTRKEVAVQLGCPEGTVASRLGRARAMLAKRLTRRGIALSGGALAAVLAQQVVSAGVPNSVVDATIQAAALLAPGKAAATGAISVKVAALAEGVMKAMLFNKLKAAIAVVLILGFVTTGATVFTCRLAAGQTDNKAAAEKPVTAAQKPDQEQKDFAAWGKAVDGLQLGLALVPAAKIAYRSGEEIKFEVRVRNVSKAPRTISYGLPESEPEITDAAGEKVFAAMPPFLDVIVIPTEKVLQPGETVALFTREVAVEEVLDGKPDPKTEVSKPTMRVRAGKYKIAFSEFVHSKLILSTGIVEVEVKEAEKQEEGFTAWGKEVGDLRAGLGYRPGERRAYHHGETVTLVVRVRNVGKETVKFEYIKQFLDEEPPVVTDADGKTIPQRKITVSGLVHVPVEVSLAPGKEIGLESRIGGASGVRYELRPASGRGKPLTGRFPPLYVGTGKVSLQYERVFGNSSAGQIQLDPNPGKLATGKLEVEIKSEPSAAIEKK